MLLPWVSAEVIIGVNFAHRTCMTVSLLQDGPSEVAHSTESSVRMPNPADESIPLTQMTDSANPQRISITGTIKPQDKSFSQTLRRAATLLVRPEKPVGEAPNAWRSIRAIILASCETNFL